MANWLIYGAGGHARVLADGLGLQGQSLLAYFDDQCDMPSIIDVPLIPYNKNFSTEAKVLIGIGNNEIRKNISEKIAHQFGTFIHPKAIIAQDVIIGEGTVVLAGAVIQTGAVIGKHVIVNANVTIDHDANIGDFCSIYPNTYIGGEAKIGNGVNITAGSIINRLEEVPAVFEEEFILELDAH